MSTLVPGALYSYSDSGTANNVSNPVMVGNGGWGEFSFLFAGVNARLQPRIYAVNREGQLLSYSDNGSPGNVANPVVVGADGWNQFKFIFAGQNLAKENRIYAVNQGGQLLSYGDNGTPGNVGHPVTVGADGWNNFSAVFCGPMSSADLTGQIYAVDGSGDLLQYDDDGASGNVGNPVVLGRSIPWSDFPSLFAGLNSPGFGRIYCVDQNNLIAYNFVGDGIWDGVTVGDGSDIHWFPFLFAGQNTLGQFRIYRVPVAWVGQINP